MGHGKVHPAHEGNRSHPIEERNCIAAHGHTAEGRQLGAYVGEQLIGVGVGEAPCPAVRFKQPRQARVLIQNGVAEAPQPQEEKKPETPKPETPKPEAPKRPKMKIQIEQMREIVQEYKQNVAEMNGIMEDLAPDPGATPQMQRNYFCARKLPVITVTRHKEKIQKPVEWICNYCGCHHHEPSECAEP